MSQTNNARYKYTPDEMSENEFLTRFVVRKEIFEEIFEELQEADYSVPNQHYIMIGQRGQGKTTLLRKLKLEVEKDKKLSKFLIPVKFSEEQYRVRQLCRLWEEVAGYLQTYYEDIFESISDEIEQHIDDENYHDTCFSYLEKAIKKQKKKLLILIDNIDVLLGKLKEKEQHQLREIMLTSSSFIIVGGSTKMFEQQYDYSKPFYEFFKIIRLESLSYEESIALLRVIGDKEQSAKIENIIQHTPERIETLRRVTGGVPRTIIMLFDIFVEDNGNAFDDLMKVLDEVTPLYKDRMDDLPPVLQEIVDTIALNWDGMLTREIAKRTRLESKVVSAQLKQLEKYQIIDSESVGKNKIYILKERFFNIWYLMRYGRKKDRNRVEWLIKFLLSWYDRSELKGKAKQFIESMQKETLNEEYVYYFGEALSYSGYLDVETEETLKQNMKSYLVNKGSGYVNEVSKSDKELIGQTRTLFEKKEYDKVLDILLRSKRESAEILGAVATTYHMQNKFSEAEKFYLMAIDIGNTWVLRNIGMLYKGKSNYKKAKEYYLKAIKSGDTRAYLHLGILHSKQKKYIEAEKYYIEALNAGDDDVLKNLLWDYFLLARNFDNAKLLIDKYQTKTKNYFSIHIYAIIFLWIEEFSKSYEKFLEWLEYENAIESGEDVTVYLTLLISKGQFYKAKEFMELPEYQLKERYKPIWYALMTLMQDDFPIEIKKMGSELKETVDEVLAHIEEMRVKYAID